jgi:hypothetical protein
MCTMGGIAQSVWRLATGWTVRESNPVGDEVFSTCPDRPRGPPTHRAQWEPAISPRSKRPVRDLGPPPHLVSPGLHGLFKGEFTFNYVYIKTYVLA